jgi:hypothetical protein
VTAAPVPARAPRAMPLAAPARLLRLELRRNPMLWLLPLLAVLFWLGIYRVAMANPPFWNVRATVLQHAVLFLGPLLGGAAAWAGSREGRRGLTDLVGTTAVPRWAAQLAAWAATTCWAEVIYLGGVAIVYGITAEQARWGGPLWWPVAVGAAGLATCCALGFAAGALLPSRFTAALAAVGVFLALAGGAFAVQANIRYALIWPVNVQGPFPSDSYGIFYPYLPDLAIDQLMFLTGIAAAALGALGLAAALGGRWLRGAAAAVTVAGLAATAVALGLAGTARLAPHGMVIPALHDAASDRPVPYVPVCSHPPVPVCLHPAYRSFLPAVTAALGPLLDQVAGLPGAPVRVSQVADTSALWVGPGDGIAFGGIVSTARPPVLELPLAGLSLPGEGRTTTAQFIHQLQSQDATGILSAVIGLAPGAQATLSGAPPGARTRSFPPGSVRLAPGALAEAAIETALAEVAGLPIGNAGGNGGLPFVLSGPAAAAARRFADLPAAARHAWLVAQLAALRAGRITVSEIP